MRKITSALALSGALVLLPAVPALAAPACEPGQTTQGCKTVDDPDKNNPKFVETQRGNVDAPGTEDTCVGANPGQTKQICP